MDEFNVVVAGQTSLGRGQHPGARIDADDSRILLGEQCCPCTCAAPDVKDGVARTERREPSVDDRLLKSKTMFDAVSGKALIVGHVRSRVGLVGGLLPVGAHSVIVEAVIGASLAVHDADLNDAMRHPGVQVSPPLSRRSEGNALNADYRSRLDHALVGCATQCSSLNPPVIGGCPLRTFALQFLRREALENVVLKTLGSDLVGLTNIEPVGSPAPVRRAVILAAGMGSRMGSLTTSIPKCLVEVNGVPILLRSLQVLASAGVTEAVVVVGYQADQVRYRVGGTFAGMQISYVDAPLFDQTNNICSLWDARRYLTEDVLLIEGDVVFDLDVVLGLYEHRGSSMAVAADRAELSGTVVRHDDQGLVTSFILGAGRVGLVDVKSVHKTVNLYLLRAEDLRTMIVPELCRQVDSGNVHAYYETVLRDLVAARDLPALVAVDVTESRWYEIDDHRDLDNAEFMFLSPDQQYDRIQTLHGSYWRYGIVDHSYLYNLHFPPQAMLDHLHVELPELVTNYPVGQAEFDRLVAQWVGAPPESIVAGNGAAELIRILGEHVIGKMTIAVPSFNECENALRSDQLDRVPLHPESFDVDLDTFAESARRAGSDVAILVTPNNPTARAVSRADILKLDDRLSSHGCRLIVDESFIEFSRGGRAESVEDDVVGRPNLAVMKSMSKVFGVAGLRLG